MEWKSHGCGPLGGNDSASGRPRQLAGTVSEQKANGFQCLQGSARVVERGRKVSSCFYEQWGLGSRNGRERRRRAHYRLAGRRGRKSKRMTMHGIECTMVMVMIGPGSFNGRDGWGPIAGRCAEGCMVAVWTE